MKTRTATTSDASAIASVHVQAWQEAYRHILPATYLSSMSIPDRTRSWQQILTKNESTTLVSESGGVVTGFVSYGHCRDPQSAPSRGEIWAIYVAPEHWRKGAGRALLSIALANLAASGFDETALWVLSDNERGIDFYKSQGFGAVPDSQKMFTLGCIQVSELQLLRRNAA